MMLASRTGLQGLADRILVERAVDNDAAAFTELIRRHSSLMRAYVYRIVGGINAAAGSCERSRSAATPR